MGLGDLRLQRDDGGGVTGGISPADIGQHPLDIGLVLLLLVRETGVQIVVAVRQADPRLARRDGVAGRVLLVDGDAGAEEGGADPALGLTHVGGDLLMGVGGADSGQEGLQRLGVQRLDARLVNIAAIGVGNLGLVRTRSQVAARRQPLNQGLHAIVRQFAQQGERAVGGAVRRNLQLVESRAVSVAEEAVARRHRGVATRQVEAPGAVLGRVRAGPAGRRGAAFGRRGAVEQLHNRAALVHAGMVVAVLRRRHSGGQQQGADSGPDQQFLHKQFPRLTRAQVRPGP
ncbi:hypothetical protein D3C85_995520 [compost metagenome]